MRQITFAPTFAGWRKAARHALDQQWPPGEILWQELSAAQPSLDLAGEMEPSTLPTGEIKVPKEFLERATRVACHSDFARWGLMYHLLWRLNHGEPHLLQVVVDEDVQQLHQMDKAIRHDVHKMRAFVRFRAVNHERATWYVAWFEPQHHIVELNSPFFIDRFAKMNWSILTPDRCAHWDQTHLSFTEGVTKTEAPTEDATEGLWIRYYSHIFNPSRVKVHAMQAEMPKKYWKNLPEAAVIPDLLAAAPRRMETMIADSAQKQDAIPIHRPASVPATDDLERVREAARHCQACPLYKNATQTVFGEGPPNAKLVFIGEQPGDSEDVQGHPFIGPAGQLLDRAMAEAGIDRSQAYVTNAVKHFKWEPSGKRRLHKKPSARDMADCRPWLEAELRILTPRILVCLGGTAAQTIFGSSVRVLRDRGQFRPSEFCPETFITVHPSALLRAPDEATKARDYQQFVGDLRLVAKQLESTT